MTWRFLDTGTGDAAFNMAVDESLFQGVIAGTSPPTIRTYCWDPPSFSIGYFQKMEQQIDPLRCNNEGISRVRRLTGGRVVLHGWDLTYSVTAAVEEIAPGGTITDAYRVISLALVEGLHSLGAEAEYERPLLPGPAAGRKRVGVKPCFTSTSRFEVSCAGRKIVGSAQRVIGNHLLQHGSLPLVTPPSGPHEFVPLLSETEKKRLGEELAARSVTLSEALGREVRYREVSDALVSGFRRILAVEITAGPLSDDECARCEELVQNKYSTPGWNESHSVCRFEPGPGWVNGFPRLPRKNA